MVNQATGPTSVTPQKADGGQKGATGGSVPAPLPHLLDEQRESDDPDALSSSEEEEDPVIAISTEDSDSEPPQAQAKPAKPKPKGRSVSRQTRPTTRPNPPDNLFPYFLSSR